MSTSGDSDANPFGAPGWIPESERRPTWPRWVALFLAPCTAVVSVISAWWALVGWAFSTMIDPALPRSERVEEIVDRFFFRDGPLLGVVLFALTWLAMTGLVATATFLFVAIAGFPRLRIAFLIACIVGTLLGVAAFVFLIAVG